MLPYTATDLVEMIRREIDASAPNPHIPTAKRVGFFQQLRRRAAAGLSARR